MKKVFEFIQADHDTVVSRTLVMVHRAIDNHFPNADPASQRFAKTVFGEEKTLTKSLPSSEWSQGNSEDTAPRRKAVSSEERFLDGSSASKEKAKRRLWRQSLIAAFTIIGCALVAYYIISIGSN